MTSENMLTKAGGRDLSLSALVAAALIVAGAVFTYLVVRVWPFTVDDAFIGFRYARNLADGFGPTYNAEPPPVEGYTGFLWLLIIALPHVVHLDAVVFAKTLGVLLTVATMSLTFVWTSHLARFTAGRARFVAGACATLFVAAIPAVAVHAVGGLETALFMLLLTGSLYSATCFLESPSTALAMRLSILLFLLGLTRPEGNLVAAVAILGVLVLCRRPDRRVIASRVAVLYVLPGALYFAWRLYYYGLFFPLPFYVKVVQPQLLAGRYDVMSFLGMMGVPMGILLLLGLTGLGRRMIPALAGASAFLVFFLFPAHIMGYDWRFLVPAVPIFCVVAGTGAAVLDTWMRTAGVRTWLRSLVSLGVLVLICSELFGAAQWHIQVRRGYAAGLARAHVALGRDLASVQTGGGRKPLLAMYDAGATPYYSGWRVLDTGGLNDAVIALSGQRSVGYIFGQDPDVVVLISRKEDTFESKPWAWWEAELYAECVKRGMVRMWTYNHEPEYYLWVMADPKKPVGAALALVPTVDGLMAKGLDELYKQGNAGLAVLAFEQVLERNADHYGGNFQLAKALDATGRSEEAKKWWEKTLVLARQFGDNETINFAQERLGRAK